MWTHISINVEVVWDDVLWRCVALWNEDPGTPPIALEKAGRVPLGTDRTPEGILAVAIAGARALADRERSEHGE